jgi:hypothetical protein
MKNTTTVAKDEMEHITNNARKRRKSSVLKSILQAVLSGAWPRMPGDHYAFLDLDSDGNCCYTVVALLLHYCHAVDTLLLHYCYTLGILISEQ